MRRLEQIAGGVPGPGIRLVLGTPHRGLTAVVTMLHRATIIAPSILMLQQPHAGPALQQRRILRCDKVAAPGTAGAAKRS